MHYRNNKFEGKYKADYQNTNHGSFFFILAIKSSFYCIIELFFIQSTMWSFL